MLYNAYMQHEKLLIETQIAQLKDPEDESFSLDSALVALEDGLVDPERICGSDFLWEDFTILTTDEIRLLDMVLGLRTTDEQVVLRSLGFDNVRRRYQQEAIKSRMKSIAVKITDSHDSFARSVLFYAIGIDAIDRDIEQKLGRNEKGLLVVTPLTQSQNSTRHLK